MKTVCKITEEFLLFSDRHKFVRRAVLIWVIWLVTYTVLKFFSVIGQVEGPAATVIVAIIGLVATGINFFAKHKDKMDD